MIPERPIGPLPIAVSDCLLGRPVRFDGSHKRSALCHEALEGLFELRGICPEVGIGMGVPRAPIRLVGAAGAPRAVGIADPSVDVTDALARFGTRMASALGDVCGYIFIKNSPSCGLFRVKVYPREGVPPHAGGRGIYAAAIARALPDLPLEENGRLNDPVLRENFVARTFVYAHWQRLRQSDISAAGLIAFHSVYKYLLMAHSVTAYRTLGRLLADLSGDLEPITARYFSGLMAALTRPATRKGHANVLSHLQGYVKQDIDAAARAELADAIESYRRGELPLLAPLTLLRHHLTNHADRYALDQAYLAPHPARAGLRREL